MPGKGRPWPKGVSGNPGGRKKLPEDIKAVRELNKLEMERLLNRFIYMKREELEAIKTNKDTTLLELFVASVVSKGITMGDERRLNFLFDRLVGRVKESVEHSLSVTLEDLVAGSMDKEKK
jgi:hypothetical protein